MELLIFISCKKRRPPKKRVIVGTKKGVLYPFVGVKGHFRHFNFRVDISYIRSPAKLSMPATFHTFWLKSIANITT